MTAHKKITLPDIGSQGVEQMALNGLKSEESNDPVKLLKDIASSVYREDLIRTLAGYRERLEGVNLNPRQLKMKYKLLRILDMAYKNENLTKVERQMRSITTYFDEPEKGLYTRISAIILSYTLLMIVGFVVMTSFESIMLPNFNIPYSVLLMGFIGCIVSMYVKYPGLKRSGTLSPDTMVWYIISPPIAVIMAGIFYGICQITPFLSFADMENEFWYYWIFSWTVGFINWIAIYDKFTRLNIMGKIGKKMSREKPETAPEPAQPSEFDIIPEPVKQPSTAVNAAAGPQADADDALELETEATATQTRDSDGDGDDNKHKQEVLQCTTDPLEEPLTPEK